MLTDASLLATPLTAHESLVPAATCGTFTVMSQSDEESYATVTAGHVTNHPFKLDTEIVKVSSKLPSLSMVNVKVFCPGAKLMLADVLIAKELVLLTSIVVPKSSETISP